MNTTAIAVEMLVIGYQTIVWLVLLFAFTPFYDDALLQTVRDWKAPLFVASVAAAYTLRAIMNGVISKIFNWIEDPLIYKHEKPSIMRAAILVQNPQAAEHIIKYFNTPRLLRSTFFNFPLIGIFSFIHLCLKDATLSKLWLVGLFTLLAMGFAFWAWYETAENYYFHLRATYKTLKRGLTETNNIL